MAIVVKVYGNISPADQSLRLVLAEALQTAIADPISQDIETLVLIGDLLTISFEGVYFPEDEVVAVLQAHCTPKQTGKLDVLDIDAWRIRRYQIQDGHLHLRQASLNQVLDYSGF
ncbi:MAG: hypothetical protein IJS54_04915 [Desulfovibrio sp.]|nr:hypothetical protein [Desulfovibrio sp.]